MLLNPKKDSTVFTNAKLQEILKATVEHFENRGRAKLKEDDHERAWYADYLEHQKQEKIFATLLTPAQYGEDDCRWDTSRIAAYSEILGFYGLAYWYTWQVSILGLGPIWMSDNEEVKKRTAQALQDGRIFAFGLSEKEHGADIYSTEMKLIPQSDGNYLAQGSKYYIGNANEAVLVSTFGTLPGKKNYVFFVVDPEHEKYECVKNICNTQNYVAEYALHDYPITESDILARGRDAWDMSLNTVNVGKFNLGWASIGICTHAFYEAMDHAANRRLFDHYVTDFTHIQQLFTDAYTRLVAMRLFALRGIDYMRTASVEDRRYLLYNPMVKMKVTTQGEEVINLLWDVIAAKGFEKDMYFEMAARDIRALPKLEGTVHVNMALIIKFMKNYFFKPTKMADIPKVHDERNDDFLFNQGPTKGLSKIKFHDYRIAYNSVKLPNVEVFKKQIRLLKAMLLVSPPSKKQIKDFDFLLNLGELFTLVAYGQAIIESSKIYGIKDYLLDQIFDVMIRDFSKFALNLYSKTCSSRRQMVLCRQMIKKPVVDEKRFKAAWEECLLNTRGVYEMNEEKRASSRDSGIKSTAA